MDWEKLGLKMGLEIHQQLNTDHKLFCQCSTKLTDEEYNEIIERNLRPTQSELGKIDRAAFQESLKKSNFKYESFDYHTCLVESDDEPPHSLNKQALEISIIIGKLMNMHIVDEFHTMRKQVIDGSNTGGFQRTGLIATDGYLETPYGKVIIESLGLEEDAARRIKTTNEYTEFRLDRLGIPLVEITTDPSMHHPKQVQKVAYMIGQVLRSTNVKRGLGTIRQDLNISIAKGARVEIKGVQNLDLIPDIVENEVKRQLALIEIKNILNKRNAEVLDEIHDITKLFENTNSKILNNANTIKAIILKGFNGIIGKEIQPGRRFGSEIASYAKKRGVSGIFHSDELPAYGITKEEVIKVKKFLNIQKEDAFIIVAHDNDTAINALEEVKRRAKLGFKGVIEETRKSLDNGNTEYLRPLATANRMYLETDIPSFKINKKWINKIASNLPELQDEKKERIIKEYKLSEDLTNQLVRILESDRFEDILKDVKVDPTPVASLLAYDLRDIKREGYDINLLTNKHLKDIFTLFKDKKIAKDSIKKLTIATIQNPNEDIHKIAENNNLILLDSKDIEKIIDEIIVKNEDMIKERQMASIGPLMGIAMKKLKGKANGSAVNNIIQNKIQKLI